MKYQATSVTGGCLCGRIRYRAEVFLTNGYMCHCTICQRSAGQPSETAVLVREGTLEYLGQEPTYFVSSEFGKRGFCAECGSRIVWQALDPENEWLTNLSVGSLDSPGDARISRHIFTDTQLPWYRVCEDLPRLTEADAERLTEMLWDEVGPEA